MKVIQRFILFIICFYSFGAFKAFREDEVELTCVKKQMSTQTCHYNFTINGIRYHFIDNGCKTKREDVIKKAKVGKLALAKDWKIECEAKKDGK
ncbi:MAG: hypothetical protein KF846_05420 [Cyclobacteriaceae bacterium]|nr:hypothetical protein [Cyclobacteriaceae bacterium]MBX2955572.1 hypothetical protein [Cyclobacteriaceae bacterium]